MPVDRLTHPRIGRSRKVTSLSDLEFRVWDTYRWSADDFGVMPKSAAKLRGENDALLSQHSEEEVAGAMQRLVEIALVAEFEHQGAAYVCSLTWQKHQKIKYPRQTHLPAPPPQLFDSMEFQTRTLFRKFHEFFQRTENSRARAAAKRLTANGKRLKASSGEDARAGFELFWGEYPKRVGRDAALAAWQKLGPDQTLANQIIDAVRSQAQYWDNPKFIPLPKNWLRDRRWTDEVTATVERPEPPARPDARGHLPPCRTNSECTRKLEQEIEHRNVARQKAAAS